MSQQAEAGDVRGTIGTEAAHEFGRVAVEAHHPFLGFPWNWMDLDGTGSQMIHGAGI